MPKVVVVICICFALLASMVAITILTVLHDDSTTLVSFIMAGVIPTITGLVAYNKADQAKSSADTAVSNTNGILHAATNTPSDKPVTIESIAKAVESGIMKVAEDVKDVSGSTVEPPTDTSSTEPTTVKVHKA